MADTTLRVRGILDSRRASLESASDAVRITVAPPARYLNLRVDVAAGCLEDIAQVLGTALPGALSAATTAIGRTVVWLGPDEWLVVEPGGDRDLETQLREVVGSAGAVVDQSGQRVSLLLDGDVPGLLAKGTAVDLRPGPFGEGAAVQGMLAQANVLFIARSSDVSRVELIARTSFAPYVADWLLDALADPLAYPASHGS